MDYLNRTKVVEEYHRGWGWQASSIGYVRLVKNFNKGGKGIMDKSKSNDITQTNKVTTCIHGQIT